MSIREEANVLTDILRSQRIQARIVGGFTAPSFYVYSLEIDHAEKLPRIQGILDTIQSTLYTWRARRGLVDVNDPDQRVARSLAALFHPLLYPGVGQLLRITQQELGYLVGLSRQRVNEALNSLQTAGVIRVEYGGVRVLDLEALRRYGAST